MANQDGTVAIGAPAIPAAPAAVAPQAKVQGPPLRQHGATSSAAKHSDPMSRLATLVSTHELVPGLVTDHPYQPVIVELNSVALASELYGLFRPMFQSVQNDMKGIQAVGIVQPNGSITFSPAVASRTWVTSIIAEIEIRNFNELRKQNQELAIPIFGDNALVGPMSGLSHVDSLSSILLAGVMPIVITNTDRHFKYFYKPEAGTPPFSLNGGNDMMEYLMPVAKFQIPAGVPNTYDSILRDNIAIKLHSIRTIDDQTIPSTTCVGKAFPLFDEITLDNNDHRIALWMDGDGNSTPAENALMALLGRSISKQLAFEDKSDWLITDPLVDIQNYTRDDFRNMIHATTGLRCGTWLDLNFQRCHYRHIEVEIEQAGVALRDGRTPVQNRTFESFTEGGQAEDSQIFRYKCKYYTKMLDARMNPQTRNQAFRKLQFV